MVTPNPRRSLRRRPQQFNRAPAASSFLCFATYSGSITSTAGGAFSYSLTPAAFGLGAGATNLLVCPQLVLGATFGSEYRLRIKSYEFNYMPLVGRSAGLYGSGVGAICTSHNLNTAPAPTLSNFYAFRDSKIVYAGSPHRQVWRPTRAPDTNWVSSSIAQAGLIPVDNSSVGCCFNGMFIGLPASSLVAYTLVRFVLEVERI
jgi:hypothetical protein